MRYCELFEMPIRQTTHVGNFDNQHAFNQQDRRALTSEKLMTKLKLKIANSKYDFVLYFVNVPGAKRLAFSGLVTDWNNISFGNVFPKKFETQILADKDNGLLEDAITIVFVDNRSDARMPMTPWIITHRIWHAFDPLIRAQSFQAELIKNAEHKLNQVAAEILHDVYKVNMDRFHNPSEYSFGRFSNGTFFRPGEFGFKEFKAFYHAIGSSRAAREKKLSLPTEIFPDLFVEYLWTGKIKFRPLPEMIKIGNTKYFTDDKIAFDQANLQLESEAGYLVSKIEDMLDACINEVFVV